MSSQIGPGFLSLPPRSHKPRTEGITHVLDKGLSMVGLESLLAAAGDSVDIIKLGWGTAYVSDGVKNVAIGDLRVRRLGFGAMRLAGAGIWGDPPDRGAALRTLQRAVALGVDFIDTADAYGPGSNEQLIADALHPYPPGLVIATKGGIVRPDAGSLGPRRTSRAPA